MSADIDPMAVAAALASALARRSRRLTLAESCTGGGIAEVVTSLPGSSAWFEQGWVTYSDASKTQQLGVPVELIARDGAVSEAVARAMASGALERSGADLAVAVTGIAGPTGGTVEKPVGTVWFAWAGPKPEVVSVRKQFAGQRDDVRRQAVLFALQGCLEFAA